MTPRRDVEILEDFEPWEAAARIAALKEIGARYLTPVIHAVADGDCRLAIIGQRSGGFRFFGTRPIIGIVGDDTDRALGPGAFNRKSLIRFLATCKTIGVVSSGGMAEPYALAAGIATLMRKNTAVIETRPEHAYEWETLAEQAAPDAQFIFCRARAH